MVCRPWNRRKRESRWITGLEHSWPPATNPATASSRRTSTTTQLERDAREVERELRRGLNVNTKFEGAGYNQDASFSISIDLLDYTAREQRGVYLPAIRFSNFGRLVTILHANRLPGHVSSRIQELLTQRGFEYVPEAPLQETYGGVLSAGEAPRTWWERYFDWI